MQIERRFILAVLVALLCVQGAAGQLSATTTPLLTVKASTAIRTVEIPGHFYVVEYQHSTGGLFSVPSTYPEGQPHYLANIKIFEIVNGNKRLILEETGQYTTEGCFEDNPDTLILGALRSKKELTPEIEVAFTQRAVEAAYAAMPLYEVNGNEITITRRGVDELSKITVDGKVVWRGKGKDHVYEETEERK